MKHTILGSSCSYLRFLYTTLQKFAARMNGTLLYRIVSSFILLTKIRRLFVGIDASGFKPSNASSYYTDRAGIRKKYVKLSIGAELREQIACSLKIRRSPKHDTVDFKPIMGRVSNIMALSIVVADKGYDSEYNHEFVREHLNALSIIPARYKDFPVWRTHGKYRKQMKRRFYRHLYCQRNKNETVLSDEEDVWRAYKIKACSDAEQGVNIQGNCLQHAQIECVYGMVSTEPKISNLIYATEWTFSSFSTSTAYFSAAWISTFFICG